MIRASTMGSDAERAAPIDKTGGVAADPDLIRAVNEKVAIIQGFTDLLRGPEDVLDRATVEWALDSISAHAEGLKRLYLEQ